MNNYKGKNKDIKICIYNVYTFKKKFLNNLNTNFKYIVFLFLIKLMSKILLLNFSIHSKNKFVLL